MTSKELYDKRIRLQLTPKEMAFLVGMSVLEYEKYEKGTTIPKNIAFNILKKTNQHEEHYFASMTNHSLR